MATAAQYLVNQTLEEARPKIVPRPNSPQAIVFHTEVQRIEVQRIKVQIRPSERRSRHVLLGTINHCDFRVKKPIPLHIDVRGRDVIVSWRAIDEFGTGASMSTACDDLGHTVAELFSSLEGDQSHLGPDLARVWSVLQEHISRRS